MKVVLIIAHNCIRPGAYSAFEVVLDRLRHDMPDARIASTSLLDLDNDLRALLREDVESVTLLPYLLLSGQHSKGDIPAIVANAQKDFPQIPLTLLPPLGEWNGFADMVVAGVKGAQKTRKTAESSTHFNSSMLAIEVKLEGKSVLVVGGGRIALRKVKTLLPTGARITVVASQFDPEFASLQIPEGSMTMLNLVERPYDSTDLRGVSMVYICTDQPAVNAQVSNDARARRIMVNNACDYLDGDFIVPARMDFGENITVTVSTRGRAPSLAKKLKQKIQTDWGQDLEQIEKNFLDPTTVS
ncbi:MAG: siroheme synthase [Fibrobacter sp.]|nr:siroheme synthase [Fibrobacter sp.]